MLTQGGLKLGTIALDRTNNVANASKHRSLSREHANRIEAQLRREDTLLALAEDSDNQPGADGLEVSAEIARRETRLAALAQAKARLEERAAERHNAEHQEYEAKTVRRQAQREAGKKPRGKEPEPPAGGPRTGDQVNLTDEKSRIVPGVSGGFGQSYNAQAAVDTDTMLVVSAHVTQACNDKQKIAAALCKLEALPPDLGQVEILLADTGYFTAANVLACVGSGIKPLLAMKRDSHHPPVLERFAPDASAPESGDPVLERAHRLTAKAGRALYGLRKQTVEPVFGIIKRVMCWRQMSMRAGQSARRMAFGDDGLEHQAIARAAARVGKKKDALMPEIRWIRLIGAAERSRNTPWRVSHRNLQWPQTATQRSVASR